MATKAKIAAVVATLCEVFNRQASEATFNAYQMGLDGIADEQLEHAATAVLQSPTQKFMPTPGELRAIALTDGRGVDSRLYEAWRTLNQAIDRHGAGRSVNFRDALINATVRMLGGWERICSLSREEFEKWFQRDFRATYARFMTHGCPADSTGYLVGETERVNQSWEGVECLFERDEQGQLVSSKVYERPIPADVAAPYTPLIESPPAAKQLTKRPADLPRIEFKKAQ